MFLNLLNKNSFVRKIYSFLKIYFRFLTYISDPIFQERNRIRPRFIFRLKALEIDLLKISYSIERVKNPILA